MGGEPKVQPEEKGWKGPYGSQSLEQKKNQCTAGKVNTLEKRLGEGGEERNP